MAVVLPILLKEFYTANDEGLIVYHYGKKNDTSNFTYVDPKLNYLVAIAYLLKNVPKAILIDELPPVSV
jgi:hypothetical protein